MSDPQPTRPSVEIKNQSGKNRRPVSLLTPGLRRLLFVCVLLGVFMLANTFYLLINRLADASGLTWFADTDHSLPKLFQTMIYTHTGVGLLTAILMSLFAIWHLPKVWKRRHSASIVSGVLFVAAGLTLTVTGLFILSAAASRNNSWAWWTHVVCGAVVPIAYVLHRYVSYVPTTAPVARRYGLVMALAIVALLVGHGFSHRGIQLTQEARVSLEKGMGRGPGGRERELSEYTDAPFVSASFVPSGSPFFPSATTTTSGDHLPSRIITRGELGSQEILQQNIDQYGFNKDVLIGAETCVRCHQDTVEQWSSSAHRFASFNNPFYEATITKMRETANESNEFVDAHIKEFDDAESVAMVRSKWCSGCHDPALMLAGDMDKTIDRNSARSQAGLTCLSCHAIDKIHNRTGNGNYNIADEQEDPYLFPDAKTGVGRFVHDLLTNAKPSVHKRQMLKPFFHTSEFCATCHKVSLQEPLNNYRWFRGQNEYDNWHDSGVALNATRTFYLPPAARQCQDCHMPLVDAPLGDKAAKNGKVRDHRFLAVNTALPFLRGDKEMLEATERFMKEDKLMVTIFAVKRGAGGDEQIAMEVAEQTPPLIAGETFDFDIVVRNLGVGHTFPGGTNDSNEGWLEVSVYDDRGDQLGLSGAIQPDGHLEPSAHVYKAIMVDKHSQRISERNAQDIHAVVLARVIGPGTADTAHFSFDVPESLAGQSLTMKARLLWRKFDQPYLEFAYEFNPQGFKQFDEIPKLPITEICAHEVTFPVVNDGSAWDDLPEPPGVNWMRYNDYGIGLLLQGDTRGARRAFTEVARIVPDRVDGPRNLARVAIRDGNLENARHHLTKCEQIAPSDAQTAWFWGVALQEEGQYDYAAMAYERVLQKFPNDRSTHRNLGRTHYLNQQYEKAIDSFDKVLEYDTEDRVAHYHKMLCYKALGNDLEAEKSAFAYELYKLDESAQKVTQKYRLAHPETQHETQPIHTHKLLPPGTRLAIGQHHHTGAQQ
jgi:tetratricopeptide (TPR) repeat protein